jgi:hypothetical protein
MEFLHERDEQKSVRRISGVRVDPIVSSEGRCRLLNWSHCKFCKLQSLRHFGSDRRFCVAVYSGV